MTTKVSIAVSRRPGTSSGQNSQSLLLLSPFSSCCCSRSPFPTSASAACSSSFDSSSVSSDPSNDNARLGIFTDALTATGYNATDLLINTGHNATDIARTTDQRSGMPTTYKNCHSSNRDRIITCYRRSSFCRRFIFQFLPRLVI